MMDRDQILRALGRLAEVLAERRVEGEVCLLGGTVMVLAFKARPSTKDIDAIFHPASLIREAARVVQQEQDLPDEWLNDGAKGFVSARHDAEVGDLPQFDGLKLTAPTAEYMLAMKCMSSRIGHTSVDPSDVADVRFLLNHLGIRAAEDAMEIVARYYPPASVPPRATYLIEELLAASDGEP